MQCLITAWTNYETELRHWLRGQLRSNTHDIDDLLQELFLKALQQDKKFCDITNPRAWFFEVARNAITDRLRIQREFVELPEDLPQVENTNLLPVDKLVDCLPRVLSEMSAMDSEIITRCDLEGMTQMEFAHLHNITIAGAKSRIQRARKRLREHLIRACQVRFDANGQVCCFVPRSAQTCADIDHDITHC